MRAGLRHGKAERRRLSPADAPTERPETGAQNSAPVLRPQSSACPRPPPPPPDPALPAAETKPPTPDPGRDGSPDLRGRAQLDPLPAARPAYAARRAIRRHRVHPATLLPAPARSPPDPACPLLPAPTPAESAASPPPAPAAPRAARRPGRHTDSHSEFRARTATVPECPRRCNGFAPPLSFAAGLSNRPGPSPR